MGQKDERVKEGAQHVYDSLVNAGIDLLIGLPGTQTLPLDRTVVQRDEMDYLMARHETAIPHIAWGHYESGGGLAATLTVPGPGDTNAAHGLKNALDDSVPIIHISADSDPELYGRHPIHEIDPTTFDNVVKENINVSKASRIREAVERGIAVAQEPPKGPVRLGIPDRFLSEEVDTPPVSVRSPRAEYDNEEAYEQGATLLSDAQRPAIYVGGGARRSENGVKAVRKLIELIDAPVFASFKGQGVVSEDSDHFIGVTGKDLPSGGKAVLETADVVLALGTDFDGLNTANWTLPMGKKLIHVDINPEEVGSTYEADLEIVDDVASACDQLRLRLSESDCEQWNGSKLATDVRTEYWNNLSRAGLLDEDRPLSTPSIMDTVRKSIPDNTIVTTDIGGHRIWSKNTFDAYSPDKFITAGSWAGMGVGLPSAIGAKKANPDQPVVTLSGDGSLFMCAPELHTAAENDLDLTIVLFNDADYGIISKSPKIDSVEQAHPFEWNSPDWSTLADSFGGQGRSVSTRAELRNDLDWAMSTSGPTLLDVKIDSDQKTAIDAAAYETEVDPMDY